MPPQQEVPLSNSRQYALMWFTAFRPENQVYRKILKPRLRHGVYGFQRLFQRVRPTEGAQDAFVKALHPEGNSRGSDSPEGF